MRSVKIEGLKKYRGRPSIDELPEPLRSQAWNWYSHFLRRRKKQGKPTPQTIRAILAGQAKRLARTTPEERSKWGRSMLSKRGGYAVQEFYRREGRTGERHPSRKAARTSANRRLRRKVERGQEWMRQAVGLPPKARSKVLPTA
jgi:hypothetical protein